MGFKNFLTNSFSRLKLGQKSNSYRGNHNNQAFLDLLRLGSNNYVNEQQAYRIYETNSAVSDAVDLIALKASNCKPIIRNEMGEVILNHDVLKFLKKPNKMETYKDFMEGVCSNYLIHKNAYFEIIGHVNSKPSEIYNLNNSCVSIAEQPNKAIYTVNANNFFAFLGGEFVLTSKTGRILSQNDMAELRHVKGFYLSSDTLKAISYLTSIERDVRMMDQSNNHNLTLLEKGFNSIGLISIDTEDNETVDKVENDIKNKRSGSGNSGNLLISKGKDIKFDSFGQTNRDMEYSKIKQMSQDVAYQRYDIPKPVIDGSAQTYNNYQTARGALYDDAVFPLLDKVFSSMTLSFIDRGMLKEDEYISYDVSNISALQLRQNEELKSLKSAQVLTLNELRSIAGYEEVDGGDVILTPSNLIPFTSDIESQEEDEKDPSKEFIEIMQKNGADESEIKDYWNEYQRAFRKD